MQREKRTKITVRSDYPTSVATTSFGSNINCIAFNLDYIGKRDIDMVQKLKDMYEEALKVKDQTVKEFENVSN